MGSRTSARRRRVAAVLLTGLALLATGCGGGGGDGGSDEHAGDGPTRGGRAADRDPAGVIPLSAGAVTVENVSDLPTQVPQATVRKVLAQTQKYVDGATVTPLLNGHAAADLQDLFLFTVTKRVGRSGPDRAALTDDAVPAASSRLIAKSQPVKFAALTDGAGGIMLIAASIDYTVRTNVDGKPITIKRFGDLYFAPTGKSTWRISAYKIGVSRETKGTKKSAKAGKGAPTTDGGER